MRNRPLTVFFIDDDEDDRYLFTSAVNEVDQDVKCIFASDGEQALAMARAMTNTLPDVIFLDLNMPRVNGIQCLTGLKEIEQFKSIPVIIYTTSDAEAEKKLTRKLGAAGFLVKPSYPDLKKKIRNIFDGLRT